MNLLLGLCQRTPSACTSSRGSKLIQNATDGETGSSPAQVAAAARGGAWLRIALPGAPVSLRRLSIRTFWVQGGAPIAVLLTRRGGTNFTVGRVCAIASLRCQGPVARAWPEGLCLRAVHASIPARGQKSIARAADTTR